MNRRLLLYINWPLVGVTALLFFMGVLNLYSASGVRLAEGLLVDPYYQKQLLWGSLGLVGMAFFMLLDYRHLKSIAWPLFLLTVVLLLAVFFVGVKVYGAQRWLNLGFMNFQPSELAKISVLILGAHLLSREPAPLDFFRLGYVLAVGCVPVLLVIKQPDLGSGITIFLILGGMIFYRGVTRAVFKTVLVAIPALMPMFWFSLHGYQKQRILSFLDPASDPRGAGYHKIQSEIAIGSGQVWGKGFLEGTQSQYRFLPEKHTDFALAVFSEEWGFVGAMTLLLIFCSFLYIIAGVARDAKDLFGSYLAAGVFFYFFWQILINMGMVLGLMPVVGIPLPFISYGGSATLVNFCLIGLLLNVSMRRFLFKKG